MSLNRWKRTHTGCAGSCLPRAFSFCCAAFTETSCPMLRVRAAGRLCSWLRHEWLAMRMAVAGATHHKNCHTHTRRPAGTEQRGCGGGPPPRVHFEADSGTHRRRCASASGFGRSLEFFCRTSWKTSTRWPRSFTSKSWSTLS